MIYRIVLIGVSFLFISSLFSQKMNGVCYVSPAKKPNPIDFTSIKRINADWIAMIPYSYIKSPKHDLSWDNEESWWGDRLISMSEMISVAKKQEFKIFLSPHTWVYGQGWPGEFLSSDEKQNLSWQASYLKYMKEVAVIAERNHVEMLSIGTEYRLHVKKFPTFWKNLIKEVRKIYSGKLTYGSNWDNFQNVSFWSDLDYIGVDVYFPLSEATTPSTQDLIMKWQIWLDSLQHISEKYHRKILFTEYGYRSVDKTAWRQWEIENKKGLNPNMKAQVNGYNGLYRSVWHKDWFAGGFIWKWYSNDTDYKGEDDDYTPQHKPVEELIRVYYK